MDTADNAQTTPAPLQMEVTYGIPVTEARMLIDKGIAVMTERVDGNDKGYLQLPLLTKDIAMGMPASMIAIGRLLIDRVFGNPEQFSIVADIIVGTDAATIQITSTHLDLIAEAA